MKTIRNIALVGAIGAGKTSLVEQMLFNSKTTTRIGKIEDGTTVMDFNPEEIERKSSVSLGVANLMWKKNKINIIDAPGLVDFSSEQGSSDFETEGIAGYDEDYKRAKTPLRAKRCRLWMGTNLAGADMETLSLPTE